MINNVKSFFRLIKILSKNKCLFIFVWIVFMIFRIEYCVKYVLWKLYWEREISLFCLMKDFILLYIKFLKILLKFGIIGMN